MFSLAPPYLLKAHKGKMIAAPLGFIVAGFWGGFFGLLVGLAFDEWGRFLQHLHKQPAPPVPPLAYEVTSVLALVSLARLVGLPGLVNKSAALEILKSCFMLDAQNVRYLGRVLAAPTSPDMLHAESLLSTLRQGIAALPTLQGRVMECLLLLSIGVDGKLGRAAQHFLMDVAKKLDVPTHSLGALTAPYVQETATPDPYAVLGLSALAAHEEVTAAYKKLISETHPDKLRGQLSGLALRDAEARATEINTAYGDIRKMRGL